MIKKTLLSVATVAALTASSAQAASFLNGGFESNDLSNWTLSGGRFNYLQGSINILDYVAGGTRVDTSYAVAGITSVGNDPMLSPNVPSVLIPTVRYGDHSAVVNVSSPAVASSSNNYSVTTLSQKVANYDGTSINFSWSAVLESSHSIQEAANFGILLRDTTSGAVLYDVVSSAASGAPNSSLFSIKNGWYYSGWQDVSINVAKGGNYELILLASDCDQGGHTGYAYLDGFGTTAGGGGDNGTGGTVPEPGSLALLGLGLTALAARRRKVTQE